MPKKFYVVLFLIYFFVGCNKQMGLTMNNELIETDRAFSALCKEKGMNHAFLSYAAEDAVMLRSKSFPIVGKKKIESLFHGDDTGFEFSWEPLYANVAKSGELGYTYGTYKIIKGESIQAGTYVSIWKKNNSGEWKFVLDSGNEGLNK
jgi:ketosteroid isomerase-like protein